MDSQMTREDTLLNLGKESGFSLLEVMLANLLCLLLLLAWSEVLLALQSASLTQAESHQIQAGARVARRTVGRSVHQAGQNCRRDYLFSPRAGELSVVSDLTGNLTDPDRTLNQPFENQCFRMNPDFSNTSNTKFDQTADLQWRSGRGSFQSFIPRTTKAGFQLHPHVEGPKAVTAQLEMQGRRLPGKRTIVARRAFQFTMPVEKNREQLFRYDIID
ncbi:MAG TPA: hypothetical protein VGL91_16100 [Acidobacteriota bacterium]|jgi:type II secretory pathway component PulJ